jgi:hypothetical protein
MCVAVREEDHVIVMRAVSLEQAMDSRRLLQQRIGLEDG